MGRNANLGWTTSRTLVGTTQGRLGGFPFALATPDPVPITKISNQNDACSSYLPLREPQGTIGPVANALSLPGLDPGKALFLPTDQTSPQHSYIGGMRVLSLFDGMSCGRIALDRAGKSVTSYLASEVDPYAMKVSAKNWPAIQQIGDVRHVTTAMTGHVDLLIGGSPCQSLTFSGKRVGLATSCKIDVLTLDQYLDLKAKGFQFEGQSYLFWEYMRILKECEPKYFLLENVKMEERWKKVFTAAIGVQPVLINSNLFSAQNRQRLYWTNIPLNALPASNPLVLQDILETNPVPAKYDLSAQHHAAFLKSYNWKHCPLNGKSKPLLASYYKQPPHCPYIPWATSPSGYRRLTPLECERLQTITPEGYTTGVSETQRVKMLGNGWTAEVVAFLFANL